MFTYKFRSAYILATLALTAVTLLSGVATGAHAGGSHTIIDPTNTYKLTYPADWQDQSQQGNLLLVGPDGNVAVAGTALPGTPSDAPLATALPKLPTVLQLGTTIRTMPLVKVRLGSVSATYGFAFYMAGDGIPGGLMAVRAYDHGRVCFLVGVIKNINAASRPADANLMTAILLGARFA